MTIKLSKTKFDQLLAKRGDFTYVACKETGRELEVFVVRDTRQLIEPELCAQAPYAEEEDVLGLQAESLPGPIGRTDLLEEPPQIGEPVVVAMGGFRIFGDSIDSPTVLQPWKGTEYVEVPGGVAAIPVEPYFPQIGEPVVVAVEGSFHGATQWDGKPLLGQQFYVTSSILPSDTARDCTVVWLDKNPAGEGVILVEVADVLPASAV